jgi:two-component sensor histidine kinase
MGAGRGWSWLTRGRMPLAVQLALGAALAALLVVVHALLLRWTGEVAPFALVFLAVLAATVAGGWRSGLAAIAVGQPLAVLALIEPLGRFSLTGTQAGALVLATASQLLAVLIIAAYQRSFDEAAAARDRQIAVRDILVAELNHRVKNTLAIVQSIARQSLRGHAEADRLRLFEDRLIALARAHDLLTREDWRGAELSEILTSSVTPFATTADRLTLAGPEVQLSPKTAVTFTLVCHELATNAAKYGALSNGSGRIEIDWSNDPARGFSLTWRESGGPAVRSPTRVGFGSRLIERGAAAELRGKVQLRFEPAGLVCTMTGPYFPAPKAPLAAA